MTMPAGTAAHIHALLTWLLDRPGGPGGERLTDEDARRSARYLAERAHSRLSTGTTPEQVDAAWPARQPRPGHPVGGMSTTPTPDQLDAFLALVRAGDLRTDQVAVHLAAFGVPVRVTRSLRAAADEVLIAELMASEDEDRAVRVVVDDEDGFTRPRA